MLGSGVGNTLSMKALIKMASQNEASKIRDKTSLFMHVDVWLYVTGLY